MVVLLLQILMKCQAELKFEESLDLGNFGSAKIHVDTIATVDKHEGSFRCEWVCFF